MKVICHQSCALVLYLLRYKKGHEGIQLYLLIYMAKVRDNASI